jgi:hypothetical protein
MVAARLAQESRRFDGRLLERHATTGAPDIIQHPHWPTGTESISFVARSLTFYEDVVTG